MAVENGKIASGELRDADKVVVDSFAALSPNDFDDTPTAGSKKLMTSGAIKEALSEASEPSDYQQVKSQVQQNTQDIAGIEDKIPAQASAQNQLADKAFVNSSIATNTATFRGSYNLVSDLGLTVSATEQQVAAAIATKLSALSITPENNDYCFVQVPKTDAEPTVIDRIDRYKCSVTESGGVTTRVWDYEWSLNNSSFTADQWNAINSGITAGLVEKLNGIQAGAQVNTIETVKVNGYALTPENKAVNVPVPVQSVNGKTGAVQLGASDVGALPDNGTVDMEHGALTLDAARDLWYPLTVLRILTNGNFAGLEVADSRGLNSVNIGPIGITVGNRKYLFPENTVPPYETSDGIIALLQNLAPDFSTSATYAVGQLCVYNNKLYRCTTAVTTAGAWTGSTNWTEATVQDILALLAPLASPAFSGRPTAPNMDAQSTDGQVANKKYVDDKVAGATPSDYNAVKAQVAANAQKLEVWLSVNPQTGVVSANYDDGQSAE